ncbi:BatD family protein [Methanohalophilus profundi]|uniref:BatD family protein n=1 Tax=Methanohalophilus profundi TaxID=2138083 RepID=UPI00101C4C39|nr:BatD family protein [Methanohalophilus profundi]
MYSRLFLSLLLICAMATTASAYTLDDVEWDTSIDSATLHWGDSVEDNGYTITAEDFQKDEHVYISISKNGQTLKHGALLVGDNLEYRDTEEGKDIRVNVNEVKVNIDEWTGNMEDPTAEIQIDNRGEPEFDISIETDRDEYDPRITSETEMEVTLKIKNDGSAKAEDVQLTVDPAGMDVVGGDLKETISSLEIDVTTEEYKLTLKVPHLWEETDLDIVGTAGGYDINGELHENEESETVTIAPKVELMITKSIPEEIYMDETARVSVSIRNNGLYHVGDITVEDEIFDHMELLDDIALNKKISLEAGETIKLFEYSLKPTRSGEFTAPATVASFKAPNGKTYEYDSNEPEIEINGPVISVTQSTESLTVRPSDEVKVSVKVSNKGNRDASVNAISEIPEDVTFVSGETGLDQVIPNDESKSYNYIIRAGNDGNFTVPAVRVSFIDMENYKGERVSNILQVNVTNTSTQETATGTSNKDDSQTSDDDGDDNSIFSDDESNGGSGSGENNENNKVEPGFGALMAIFILAGIYVFGKKR